MKTLFINQQQLETQISAAGIVGKKLKTLGTTDLADKDVHFFPLNDCTYKLSATLQDPSGTEPVWNIW